MAIEPVIAEEDLDIDINDPVASCKYAVCVTGLVQDSEGAHEVYFKVLQLYDDGDEAIKAAWQVSDVSDRPAGVNSFTVTVEEVLSEDDFKNYEFAGTIFKTDLIL